MDDQFNVASPADPKASGDRENEFISNLLKRQDSVLESLDELNTRIENAILEIGKSRQELDPTVGQAGEKVVERSISKAA